MLLLITNCEEPGNDPTPETYEPPTRVPSIPGNRPHGVVKLGYYPDTIGYICNRRSNGESIANECGRFHKWNRHLWLIVATVNWNGTVPGEVRFIVRQQCSD